MRCSGTAAGLAVFPTPVGMNRSASSSTGLRPGVPHARGDEPESLVNTDHHWIVFPTPVGMNPTLGPHAWSETRVPHARGDEPGATRC